MNNQRKAIILAGGRGTRLYPVTKAISKQLLPLYDKPLIYYSISMLLKANVTEFLIISSTKHLGMYKDLLGDGSNFGINISYASQQQPSGIPEAFILGEEFLENSDCILLLGDNIFYGKDMQAMLEKAYENYSSASIFIYEVEDSSSFGVAEIDEISNVISIEEKPRNPKSSYAVTGIYFYPKDVIQKSKLLKPSKRGELEITDINLLYLEEKKLKAFLMNKESIWYDTGTFSSFLSASNFICSEQEKLNKIIFSPEETALEKGLISKSDLKKYIYNMSGPYIEYLKSLL